MVREETIRVIGEIVEKLGYECLHVTWANESARAVIRIYIDSVGGIGVADCEVVSKAVNRRLDSENILEPEGRYYLEVSSPGLERPLFTPGDYARFRGREARVKTLSPLGGRKLHTGFIEEADETLVKLATDAGTVEIPFAQVARASLVFRGLEAREPKRTKKKQNGTEPEKEYRKKRGKRKEEH